MLVLKIKKKTKTEKIFSILYGIVLAWQWRVGGSGKKNCRKNRFEATARHNIAPSFLPLPSFFLWRDTRNFYDIALTVPDGRTRFSIIFWGAFYWLYYFLLCHSISTLYSSPLFIYFFHLSLYILFAFLIVRKKNNNKNISSWTATPTDNSFFISLHTSSNIFFFFFIVIHCRGNELFP